MRAGRGDPESGPSRTQVLNARLGETDAGLQRGTGRRYRVLAPRSSESWLEVSAPVCPTLSPKKEQGGMSGHWGRPVGQEPRGLERIPPHASLTEWCTIFFADGVEIENLRLDSWGKVSHGRWEHR